jgi:predicted nucleic acid-binding protein
MILVDSGYLMALAQPRDALHRRATAWSRALTERLVVTEYVVWEMLNALSAPVDRGRAHALLQNIVAESQFELVYANRDLWDAGLRLHAERGDKFWSLTDCISFHIMWQRGLDQGACP